ncbi:MAG: YfhO family protein, partial [Lachnospiraceae bacterium]
MPQLSHQKKNGTSGRYLLYAFLLNLVIAIFAFVFSIASQGGLFSLAGDLNSQQINFITHGIEVLREGSAGFDYSIDLGSDFIGSMAFYILGNPSFYLASLFPPDMLMYVMGWIYVLKYALAGLTSFIFIRRFVENPSAAVVASVMYAFSGFMNTNLLFYHFHDVVLLFPLMLITLDDLIEKNRRGPFIAAVFLNAIVSYYFLPGEVIFLALYFVVRYLPADFGKYIKKLPSILFEGVLGCAAGMTLLLPAFLSVINNPRVEVGYSGSNALVYSEQRYLLILKGILFPGEIMSRQSAVYDTNFGSYSVYLPMVGMILVLVFIAVRKRHWISRLLKLSLVFAL